MVSTVAGGVVGYCVMLKPRAATNPYAIMTIACTIVFVASFPANTRVSPHTPLPANPRVSSQRTAGRLPVSATTILSSSAARGPCALVSCCISVVRRGEPDHASNRVQDLTRLLQSMCSVSAEPARRFRTNDSKETKPASRVRSTGMLCSCSSPRHWRSSCASTAPTLRRVTTERCAAA